MNKPSTVRQAAQDATRPKAELIRILDRLEQVEARRAAKSLGRIIGQLEAWQAKHEGA